MNASATVALGSHKTFSSSRYLAKLMGELDRAAISVRLQKSRDEAGMTQPEMGDALNIPVHWRTIQDWESPKKKTIPFDRLDEWAAITGTTKAWLLHGEEAPAVKAEDAATLARLGADLAAVRQSQTRMEDLLVELLGRRAQQEPPASG